VTQNKPFQVEFLCYTFNVEEKHELWRIWKNRLQRWGLHEITASLLEASGPLNVVLAQLLYIGQPLMPSTQSQSSLGAFAAMLEDRSETLTFVTLLREGTPL